MFWNETASTLNAILDYGDALGRPSGAQRGRTSPSGTTLATIEASTVIATGGTSREQAMGLLRLQAKELS